MMVYMTEHHYSASKYIKEQGLPSLVYVANAAQIDRQLLHTWYRTKPALFEIVVAGCVSKGEELAPQKIYGEMASIKAKLIRNVMRKAYVTKKEKKNEPV